MNPTAEIEFIVDEQYENEKGVFTVLSIHRNEMVIRWDSGEEIKTDIELQRNIQARRQWEQLQKEKEAKAAKAGSGKHGTAKGGLSFAGLMDSDFKSNASGTRWRGRGQLGGAVTQRLPDSRFNFNSWAFANKSEMHWLDIGHQKKQAPESGVKFFARADRQTLNYGFRITRPDDSNESAPYWNAFINWLANEESDRLLQILSEENKLAIKDGAEPQSGTLIFENEAWRVDNGKKQLKIDSASAFIDSLPATGTVTLEIAKQVDKENAVAAGVKIAEDIAQLFARLMPAYQAAWPVLP